MKARKKPVVVEVSKFDIFDWIDNPNNYPMIINAPKEDRLINPIIQTLEGIMDVEDGSYIIQGIEDEYYACRADIFEKTYEIIEEETAHDLY